MASLTSGYGPILKAIRRYYGLSRSDLKMNPVSISRIENDKVTLTASALDHYSQATGLSPNQLLFLLAYLSESQPTPWLDSSLSLAQQVSIHLQ